VVYYNVSRVILDCCHLALHLLDQLDAQTIPLFLADRSIPNENIKLYDVSLRPTRRTYKLALQICSEAAAVTNKPVQEKVTALALHLYRVMTIKREFPPGNDTVLLLAQLQLLMSNESTLRSEIDNLLNDVKVSTTVVVQ
jgi:hypothetical protein